MGNAPGAHKGTNTILLQSILFCALWVAWAQCALMARVDRRP